VKVAKISYRKQESYPTLLSTLARPWPPFSHKHPAWVRPLPRFPLILFHSSKPASVSLRKSRQAVSPRDEDLRRKQHPSHGTAGRRGTQARGAGWLRACVHEVIDHKLWHRKRAPVKSPSSLAD
jgi:hypothetical protein